MRLVVACVACVAIALILAGCDPVTDRTYMDEGAGVDLYTANRAKQVELQNQYIDYICQQAGLAAAETSCASEAFNAASWGIFLEAGMNDIDQRCDSYLTWLDARRRDKEPVLAELQQLTSATHTIMTISGASPKSLDIVTSAFGLASATYTNWNSRLLVSVDSSTVQNVVYKSQGEYRTKITGWPVNNLPTAVYLLRNYLRLCMPTTIEASINTSSTLVSYNAQVPGSPNLVVGSIKPALTISHPSVDTSYATLRAQLFPVGSSTADPTIVAYVRDILGPPTVAIGVILNDPKQASLRQKISACIVARSAGQPCASGSLSKFR